MIDWEAAPEWAKRHGFAGLGRNTVWFNDEQYAHVGSGKIYHFGGGVVWGRHEINDVTDRPCISSEPTTVPTLETMLVEWRDLEARAQAAQAEADALFEHAGQCHGEIVVRLAELGWGAPRAPMVPGEPVVTLDDMTHPSKWLSGDIIEYASSDYDGQFTQGRRYVFDKIEESGDVAIRVDDEGDPNGHRDHHWRWISRPSAQP